jgi:hypothetical protein
MQLVQPYQAETSLLFFPGSLRSGNPKRKRHIHPITPQKYYVSVLNGVTQMQHPPKNVSI